VPSDQIVDRALLAIEKRTANYEYFFDQLTSPDWLEPLMKRGFFKTPRDPIYEGGYVRYPLWPESRYLARMAGKAPEKVLEILREMKDTANLRVHQDLAEAACDMPPSLAAEWARKEARWLKSQNRVNLLLPDTLGKLMSHLALGGETSGAFLLARVLLEPLPPAKLPEERGEFRMPLSPLTRVDLNDYTHLLELHIPDLVSVAPMDTFQLLCEYLEIAVRIHLDHDSELPENTDDLSWIWRPAVEDHEQNWLHTHEIHGLLVSSVRDVAQQIIAQDDSQLDVVIQMLEQHQWNIFKRIALYLLRTFPDAGSAQRLIEERLSDSAQFDNADSRHEYALLLKEQFPRLGQESRAKILSFVEQPVDAEHYNRGFEKAYGRAATEEDVGEYVNRKRLRWLSLIADALPSDWKAQYDALVATYGPAEHPEFLSHVSGGWVGPTSPKTDEQLAAMSIEELLEYLRSWQPSGELFDSSSEGLARGFAGLVRSRPREFAEVADQFIGLDPTYVRAAFDGFSNAGGEQFSWPAILRLAKWVVDQTGEIPGRRTDQVDRDVDPDWGWTRTSIARLLRAGFESETNPFTAELRELVWQVLQSLTEDPEPTPEYEERYGGSNTDPLTLSINTTRGEAMHGVVRYALWVRRQIEAATGVEERLARGFNEMPEVREVLARHLEPEYDPSLAIRAVYGQWLPWLVLLDKDWITENLGRIFPAGAQLEALGGAVWDTYVVLNKVYDNVFDILSPLYFWAVDRLGSESRIKSHLGDPDQALARHLMMRYWQGKLDLHDPEGILRRFYSKAPDIVRGHAIAFIGRSLKDTSGQIPDGILQRLRELWEWRLSEAADADGEEVAAFGWWFISEAFDDEWLVANLREALRRVGKTEPAHMVVERLAHIADSFPLAAVECLSHMVRGDEEGWGLHMWRDNAKAILATALASDNLEAREAAQTLAHELGARGNWHFRELLTGESTLS